MHFKSCSPYPLGKIKRSAIDQTLLAMKLIVVFILLSCFNATAAVYAQQISLHLNNAPLEKAFDEIQNQSGYTFLYKDAQIADAKVTISIDRASLESTIEQCLKGQFLTFEVVGKTVVIKTKPQIKSKPTSAIPLDDKTIRGRVTDTTKAPIRGVSVKVEGTSITTSTDNNGQFTITASNNSILIFSAIGYQSQSITITDNRPINITLHQSTSKLDEVQVIAYGTTTQRLATGSITKVSASEIEKQPISNPLAALQGRVAGLNVTQTSGGFGSSFTVELRGQNALASSGGTTQAGLISSPLFIIDGIPFAPNNSNLNTLQSTLSIASNSNGNAGLSPFNNINPQDIESIEVLKDADATAIYGSRGGNGVIIITTKKGKAGKTRFNANVSSGVSQVSHLPDLMNSQQYLEMRKEAFKNDNIIPTNTNAPDLMVFDQNRYTDFSKLFIGGNANATDVQTSLSGGSNNTTFLFNSGYHYETTVFPTDKGSNRISALLNLNHSSEDKKFKLNISASYSSAENNLPANNFLSYLTLEPNYPSFTDANGNPQWNYKGASLVNPMASLNATYKANTNNLLSSMSIQYQLLKGLDIRANLGYNTTLVTEISKSPINSADPQYAAYGSSALYGNNDYWGWSAEPQIEYNTLLGEGKLDILTGGTWQSSSNKQSTISGYGYTNDALLGSPSAAGSLTYTNSSYDYRYQAFFGRINYNLDDRYILNVTGRRDGSSRFGPDKEFSNFGAVGGAWIFSNESFAKFLNPTLSYGKLRGSYGITGTDQIANYQYLDSWSTTTVTYQGSAGLYPTRLANPDYSWEKNKKLEIGLELGFLKDRFLLTSTYYHNLSDNHLINYALPSQTGFTTITENFPATILNRGFEFTLMSKNIATSNFNWTTSANISFAKNKLASFPNIETSSYNSFYTVGQSLDIIKGYGYSGVDKTSGSFVFNDIDKNGSLGTPDVVNLGDFNPKYSGGLNNSFSYNNWQIDIFFEFKKQLGLNYLGTVYTSTMSPGYEKNVPVELLDRWQIPGNNAKFRKYTTTNTGLSPFLGVGYNGLTISDASYIRLKNASINYNLPNKLSKILHLNHLRLYAQGQNIFTITRYKETDPETQSLSVLPPLRTIILGIQLTI